VSDELDQRPQVPEPDAASAAATPILILGIDGGSMHHGALGIMRSAGQLGVAVFHAHAGGDTPISRSRYNAGRVRLPEDATSAQRIDALLDFSRSHGRALLIPVDDVSAMFVEEHSEALREAFLFPQQPAGLARSLAGKRDMHELCLRHDVPTPLAMFPSSRADVAAHGAEADFPVVLKRIDASLPCAPAAPSVAIAHSPQELLAAYALMESPQAPNVMLQEYIPGSAESIWMLNGYFDADSECPVAFTGQKIRQAPPRTGATTLGVCRSNPVVESTTRAFMKAVGYRGILDLGYRYDARDGQYKLLDVNPRIGATFRLFVGPDGMDVLRAMYLDLTGQSVPGTSQTEGRRWLVEPLDLRTSLTLMRERELTPGAWARSLRGVQETAWFSRDDYRPTLATGAQLLRGRLRKLLPLRGTAA
jgi:D-aspartate ligase